MHLIILLITPTAKPRFGCRLHAILRGKSGVYMGINEHFSHRYCVQDAPNMRFYSKKTREVNYV